MSFNPTVLAPIATVLASIATLAVPLYLGISQNKLQKRMHNRDCMLVRQEKLLEIYNVFASCLNKLNINAVLQKMKMGQPENFPVIMLDHADKLYRSLDEARLLLDDEKLLQVLKNIAHKYSRLVNEYIDLIAVSQSKYAENLQKVCEKFPGFQPLPLSNILNNKEVADYFNELNTTEQSIRWERDVDAFKKEDLSFKNFDIYFKKHIITAKL